MPGAPTTHRYKQGANCSPSKHLFNAKLRYLTTLRLDNRGTTSRALAVKGAGRDRRAGLGIDVLSDSPSVARRCKRELAGSRLFVVSCYRERTNTVRRLPRHARAALRRHRRAASAVPPAYYYAGIAPNFLIGLGAGEGMRSCMRCSVSIGRSQSAALQHRVSNSWGARRSDFVQRSDNRVFERMARRASVRASNSGRTRTRSINTHAPGHQRRRRTATKQLADFRFARPAIRSTSRRHAPGNEILSTRGGGHRDRRNGAVVDAHPEYTLRNTRSSARAASRSFPARPAAVELPPAAAPDQIEKILVQTEIPGRATLSIKGSATSRA